MFNVKTKHTIILGRELTTIHYTITCMHLLSTLTEHEIGKDTNVCVQVNTTSSAVSVNQN